MFAKHSLILATMGGALVTAAPSGQRSIPGPCAEISQQYMYGVKNGSKSDHLGWSVSMSSQWTC